MKFQTEKFEFVYKEIVWKYRFVYLHDFNQGDGFGSGAQRNNLFRQQQFSMVK